MSVNAPPPTGPPVDPPAGSNPSPESAAPPAGPEPDPTKRACPSCGAQNPHSASFCWQCHTALAGGGGGSRYGAPSPGGVGGPAAGYTPPGGPGFGGGSPPAGGTSGYAPPGGTAYAPAAGAGGGGGYGPPAPSGPLTFGAGPPGQAITTEVDGRVPLPPSRTSGGGGGAMGLLRVLVPLIAAIAGFYFGYKLLTGGLSIPEEISGVPRSTGTQSEQTVKILKEGFEDVGLDAEIALFGEGTNPSFLVLVLQGSDPPPPETNFQQFAAGFGTTASGQIEVDEIQRRDFGGVTYLCAPTTTQVQGICLWQIDDTVGIVAGFDRDLAGVFQFTVAAHDAIQG
ncbi:MAG: hypothetical protein WD770_08335 [Actinomycetota bacterium]